MRLACVVVATLFVGCLDGGASVPASTVRVLVPDLQLDDVVACYHVTVTDDAGTTWIAGGGSSAPATAELAATAGAVCSVASEETGIEVVGDCAPGRAHTATLGVAGLYDATGARVDYVDPCGEAGCTHDFTCVEGEETTVVFELTILRDARQGFFDLAIEPLAAGPLDDACYAIRVQNAEGEVVWANDGLCSSEYGNDAGSVSYIGPCDAAQPEHDVTVWVVEIASGEATYSNPCPAPASGAVADWTGGCSLAATCVENDDVTVRFNLSFIER